MSDALTRRDLANLALAVLVGLNVHVVLRHCEELAVAQETLILTLKNMRGTQSLSAGHEPPPSTQRKLTQCSF